MRGSHFDHGQVAHYGGFVRNVLHQQHVDQLIEIGLDAACLIVIGVDRDGHARDLRLLGAADGERIDVEGAAAKQRRHTRQHARFIFHVHHVSVQHVFSDAGTGLKPFCRYAIPYRSAEALRHPKSRHPKSRLLPYSSSAVSTILLGRRIISCNDAPAATMGYTVSSCSTRKLISTGPSCCRAARTEGTTCDRSVTVILRIPYASPSLAK